MSGCWQGTPRCNAGLTTLHKRRGGKSVTDTNKQPSRRQEKSGTSWANYPVCYHKAPYSVLPLAPLWGTVNRRRLSCGTPAHPSSRSATASTCFLSHRRIHPVRTGKVGLTQDTLLVSSVWIFRTNTFSDFSWQKYLKDIQDLIVNINLFFAWDCNTTT